MKFGLLRLFRWAWQPSWCWFQSSIQKKATSKRNPASLIAALCECVCVCVLHRNHLHHQAHAMCLQHEPACVCVYYTHAHTHIHMYISDLCAQAADVPGISGAAAPDKQLIRTALKAAPASSLFVLLRISKGLHQITPLLLRPDGNSERCGAETTCLVRGPGCPNVSRCSGRTVLNDFTIRHPNGH